MTDQAFNLWQKQNNSIIRNRLKPHLAEDEIARILPSKLQGIFVRRIGSVLELYCYDPSNNELSEVMSRIDLANPLHLLGTYSQVMLLSACWTQKKPENVYIAGFGGGRLGMLLHYCIEGIRVHGSDFDPAILDAAEMYFGVTYDERYDVRAADSASDLASRNTSYDIIMIDVFSNSGEHPDHLGTESFLKMCQSKLTLDGVVIANLVERDHGCKDKISTFMEVFPYCYLNSFNGAHITFGSQIPIDHAALKTRCEEFEQSNGLDFQFAYHVNELKLGSEQQLSSFIKTVMTK